MKSAEGIALLKKMGKPCVLIGRYFLDLQADAVLFDDVKAGYMAGKHLSDQGYREVLMLTVRNNTSAADRVKGFLKAVSENDEMKCHVVPTESPMDNCTELIGKIYGHGEFDAVLAVSDLMAMEVSAFLEEKDIPQGANRCNGL